MIETTGQPSPPAAEQQEPELILIEDDSGEEELDEVLFLNENVDDEADRSHGWVMVMEAISQAERYYNNITNY